MAGRAAALTSALCAGVALAGLAVAPAGAVELELVLAVDASTSVDFREFNLQMAGYSAAFRHPDLHDAIASVADGIAVTMVLWSGPGQSARVVEWTEVRDPAGAERFAAAIDDAPRLVSGGSTAIGDVIAIALGELDGNGIAASRQTIDISGDGKSNDGRAPGPLRDAAAAAGITINGLVILNEEPDVDVFYRSYVIGGPGAFLDTVDSFRDFAEAILRKLVREIRAVPMSLDAPADALPELARVPRLNVPGPVLARADAAAAAVGQQPAQPRQEGEEDAAREAGEAP